MLEKSFGAEDWLRGWSSPEPTTYQGSDALAFQRWFKFKEAFAPSLVTDIIESLPHPPGSILDCCGGSGTTGLVAQFLGIESHLIEVNPFLVDLIVAKTADYGKLDIPREVAKLLNRLPDQRISISHLRSRLPRTFVQPGVGSRWLFSQGVAMAVESLRLAIEETDSLAVRRLFRVALGAILIDHSNVRLDGKGRRYRQNWQARQVDPSSVLCAFLDRIDFMVEDIYRFEAKRRAKVTVIRGDARNVLPKVQERVDAVIFSPPYPNSFDYTDIYNVELWMLGYFKEPKDNSALRLCTMRSHVQIKWPDPSIMLPSATLEASILQLQRKKKDLWSTRLPDMVQAYFEDLLAMIQRISAILNPGGSVAIVVGDSSYAGIKIDCAAILSELTIHCGLQIVEKKSVRVMRASMQQVGGKKVLDEWLLVFRRTD